MFSRLQGFSFSFLDLFPLCCDVWDNLLCNQSQRLLCSRAVTSQKELRAQPLVTCIVLQPIFLTGSGTRHSQSWRILRSRPVSSQRALRGKAKRGVYCRLKL